MSRRNLCSMVDNMMPTHHEKTQFDVYNFIENYYEKDVSLKKLKKECEEDKETIKNYFIDNSLKELSSNNVKCTVTESRRDTLNTDMCIQILHNMLNSGEITEMQYNSVIKHKPYVDEDALESLIYNKEIDGSRLSACIDSKTVYTCKISKKSK